MLSPILASGAEQGTANAPALIGQEQDGAGFRRPAARFDPVALDLGKALQLGIVLGGDEPDRQSLASPLEQKLSQVTARFRQTSRRHGTTLGTGLDGGPH